MWEMWKSGSSLDGSGIFTRTSFRNKGWKQIVYIIDIIYYHNSHTLFNRENPKDKTIKRKRNENKKKNTRPMTSCIYVYSNYDCFFCQTPFGLNGQNLLICTSCSVYWTLGWRVCLSLKKWTAWQLGSGEGNHWKGKHTVPYCSWS